jgi:O-antigen/teichoic acid export membrane protein
VHLLAAIAQPLNTVLMISNRQRTAFACLLVNAAVTFCLCAFLVPKHGGLGAALSILGGSLAYLFALGTVALLYRYKLSLNRSPELLVMYQQLFDPGIYYPQTLLTG